MEEKEELTWAGLIHVFGLIGITIMGYIGNILFVLVFWLLRKNYSAFIDRQGKEALNFQITLSLVCVMLGVINGFRYHHWDFSSFIHRELANFSIFDGYGILWIANLIFSVMAAVQASGGKDTRYPLSLRFVR